MLRALSIDYHPFPLSQVKILSRGHKTKREINLFRLQSKIYARKISATTAPANWVASAQRAPPGCFTQEGRSRWWAFGADIPLPEKRRSILRLPRAQVRGTQSFLLGHHQWKEFPHQEIHQGAHPLTTYKCLVFSRSIHPSIQQNFLCITIACISLYHSCPQRYWWPDVVLPVDQPPTPNPTPALYPSGSPDLHTTSDSA